MQIRYNYKGRDKENKIVTGKIKARSKQKAANALKTKLSSIIELKPYYLDSIYAYCFSLICTRISSQELMLFSYQLGTLINSGIPVLEALKALADNFSNTKFSYHINNMVEEINQGKSLSEAMAKETTFPSIYVAMIRAGEESGAMEQVLFRITSHYEKDMELLEKAKQALTYPVILIGVSFIVIYIIITRVIPEFVNIFTELGAELPFFTMMLLRFGEFIHRYWPAGILIFMVFFIGKKFSFYTLQTKNIKSYFYLKIPIIGDVYRKVLITRFSRNLATLLKCGIPINNALTLVKDTNQNEWMKEVITSIKSDIENGLSLSDSFCHQDLFPLMTKKMVIVGEETGTFDNILFKIGDYYEKESTHKLNQLTTFIEPLLILIMMTIVGFLVFSVITPMMELWNIF